MLVVYWDCCEKRILFKIAKQIWREMGGDFKSGNEGVRGGG